MEQKQLESILESLLFTSGRPLRAKDLAKVLEMEEQLVKTALEAMVENKKDNGIILLGNKGEYQLSTNSKNSTQVKNFLNAELREKLTDATVEVLAIIAYRQPISKAEIEAIRGVNSQYSLRNLLMRGLIEKITNASDARSFLYQTTTEFLMHMGLTSVKDLPEFEKLVSQIKLPETAALAQEPSPTPSIEKPIIEELQTQEPEPAPDAVTPLTEETPPKEAEPTEEPEEEEEIEDDEDEDE